MIIVKLAGGLGNQMFEFAFGKYLALKNNTELKLDLSFLLDRSPKKLFVYRDFDLNIFNNNTDIANKNDLEPFDLKEETFFQRLIRLQKQKKLNFNDKDFYRLNELSFQFNKDYLKFPKNSYLEGFWQSEKYFKDIEDVIRNDFTFKNPLDRSAKELSDKIKSVNAVCINVRRGYINNLKEKYYHGFLGLEYINQAKELIKSKIDNPHFFVFSDDINWCEANIKDDECPVTFVSHKYAGEKFQFYLQLMIECNHFIIPNSSFGWWAAWLNQNPDKIVIAPKKWFRFSLNNTKDLIPDKWIRI